MDKINLITCEQCKACLNKDEQLRSCCNCFCCTGCEIYIFSNCQQEILVLPRGQAPQYTRERK